MDMINSVIHSAVEFSNVLSCFAVLSCTGAVFIFLLKATIAILAQREEALGQQNNYSQNVIQVPRLKMTRVHIPFTFKLFESGNNSTEEIKINIASQVKYSVQGFWGVSIRDLHMFLWKPWSEIRNQAYEADNAILASQYYHQIAIDRRDQEPHGEQQITLQSPKPPMVLGAPPRLVYPLVLFLIRDKNSKSTHPDETVVLVNVIHLRDPVCPLPTSILAQYLKQANGQLSCLKQLYLAAGESATEDITTSTQSSSLSLAEPVACAGSAGPLLCSDGPQPEQVCIVCHYFPLSRALLPCRHTCICAICFAKLNRCPMCRAPITSYFCIRAEDYIPPGAFEQRSSKTKNTIHWLDALNDRLTDFLGFR